MKYLHGGIRIGLDAALKVRVLALDQFGRAVERCDEARHVGDNSVLFDDALVARRVLQVLQLLQGVLVVGLGDERVLGLDDHGGRGDGLAQFVGGAARVRARVLRVHVLQVQSDEAEVVECRDAAGVLQGHAILEPLHLQLGIANGDQARLEVSALVLHQHQVLHRLSEHRSLSENTAQNVRYNGLRCC